MECSPILKNEIIIDNLNSEIILGKKIKNPYTMEIIKERSVDSEILPESNFYYFRARSKDIEKLKWLNDRFTFMSIIPLDREIEQGGTYWKDPEYKEGEAPWFYFMKFKSEYEETVVNGLETEILEEMYISEEDYSMLRCKDLEIPKGNYITVNLTGQNQERSLWSDFKGIISKYVANYPDGEVSVYDTVLSREKKKTIIYYDNEQYKSNFIRDTGKAEIYSPVKNIQVLSHQLGVIGTSFTDSNGKFFIPIPYTSLGYKVQIVLRFQNTNLTLFDVQGDDMSSMITDAPTLTSVLTGAMCYYEGSHWIEGLTNMSIKFDKDSRYGKYVTIMNAVSDYHDFCSEYNITHPEHLKIVAVDSINNSCAPLTNYATGATLKVGAELLKSALGIPAGTPSLTTFSAFVSTVQPDIVIATGGINSEREVTRVVNDYNLTEKIYGRIFHELSHASHYFGLDIAGRSVWMKEYIDMLKGWKEAYGRGENPMDNCYNNGGTDLVKLIESWGYFSENYAMAWKFRRESLRRVENGDSLENCNGEYPFTKENKIGVRRISRTDNGYYKEIVLHDGLENDPIEILEKGKLDKYTVDESTGQLILFSKCYFSYDGFYDLIDYNQQYTDFFENEADDIDYTQGYTYQQLFDAITVYGSNDYDSFAQQLIMLTPGADDVEFENVKKTINENCGNPYLGD